MFLFSVRVASQEYYYPTLYHHKVELEDGFTDNDRAANLRHSESEFTGFSWRGYVVFTQSQVTFGEFVCITDLQCAMFSR